jgi:hypothetical protein
VNLSDLRTLVVLIDEDSGPKWVRWVRNLGSSLEYLTLDLSEFDVSGASSVVLGIPLTDTIFCAEPSFDRIDIGPQTNLKSLSLTVKFSSIMARFLRDLFSNLVPSNLQHLSFDISDFQGYFDENEVWTRWKDVGCALERHPLSQLRSVKVFVSLGEGRYRRKLDEIFPSLAARGIMESEFTP